MREVTARDKPLAARVRLQRYSSKIMASFSGRLIFFGNLQASTLQNLIYSCSIMLFCEHSTRAWKIKEMEKSHRKLKTLLSTFFLESRNTVPEFSRS